MILFVLASNAVLLLSLRALNKRVQFKMEQRRWAPHRQNAVLDPMLRHYLPPSENPRHRMVATRIKNGLRNFINSEAFSIAVDGVVNTQSSAWSAARLLRKLRGENKFELDDSVCTIH